MKSLWTMLINLSEAVKVFSGFDSSLQIPTLHPEYVVADAKRKDGLQPVFWFYEEGPLRYYHGFHVAPIAESELFDIQSPYGYGGPISNTEDQDFLFRAWDEYETWCRNQKIVAEFIRFHPLLQNWNYYGGVVVEDRETVAIDLAQQDLLTSYMKRARTEVRKAIKEGLQVQWLSAAEYRNDFMRLYESTIRNRNADEFYLFNDTYFTELFSWPQAKLAACTFNREWLATAILLTGPSVMEYHLSASNETGRQMGATNLLLHEAAQYGQLQGCKFLYLGGGTDNSPTNPLLFFKSGFLPLRVPFKIGRHIHLPEMYEDLKERWPDAYGQNPHRVIFYR